MTVISGALVAIGFTAAAASFVASTAISIGLSALARALAGKPKVDTADLSVKGQLDRGANIPQSFIVGKYATAGTLTYANTRSESGFPNAWMNWVITLSDLPIEGIGSGLWVNGAYHTFGPDPANPGWMMVNDFSTQTGNSALHLRFYDGTQTTADDWLPHVSTVQRPWSNSGIGKGKAYVVVRAWLHEDAFPTGFPKFLFVVRGSPLYNPAKDSSVGGSGSHRWTDQSTWEVSESPAVQLYNILRGVRYEGEWFYGLQGVSEAQLPVAHWIGQINKCAATIQGANGPEPLFRSSAEIPVSAEVHTVIESLLDACNGRLSDAGGVYKLFAGAPDTPIMSFTDDDIISTSDQSFTPFLGLSDTVNGVTAKYPEPSAAWQVETAPPLYRPDYEVEDGGRRLLVDVNLDFVPYAEQAQRLMKAALNEARRARRHTFTMPPEFWQLEPGDTVAWTSERNGYVDKWFRVDGIVDGPDADVVLDLTEVDPADYVFDTTTDFTPPTPPSVEPQPTPAQQVAGFMVYPHELSDAGGVDRRPAILVSWDAGDLDVRTIKFQIRVKATGDLIPSAQTNDLEDGQLVIEQGILPATEYEVRAKHIPKTPRPSDWTIWRSVTTPDIRYGYGDLDQQIQDDINEIADNAGIPTFTTLPAAGDKPNQIVLKMPEAVLYRWDDPTSDWSPQLYTDIQDDQVVSDMIAAGAIIASKIGAGEVDTPALAAGAAKVGNIEIDNQLVISADKGAFVMGKDGAYNEHDDGIYMGRTEEPDGALGFGFHVSKTDSEGLVQSLSATYDTGLKITNAKHLRNFDTMPIPTKYTSSTTEDIPSNVRTISVTLQGAGGGGMSGVARENPLVFNAGSKGADTIVRIKDGATVVKEWVAAGGSGASDPYDGSYWGQDSPWGAGGQYGGTSQGGGWATGYGAGGGGGGPALYANTGRGGFAGDHFTVVDYDVSGLANPKIQIVIGAGGVGGVIVPGRAYQGGDGSRGRVITSVVKDEYYVSDVIPLEPQQWGTMRADADLPDLGAGFWTISRASGDFNLSVGVFKVSDDGGNIMAMKGGFVSFVSSRTPTRTYNDNKTHDVNWTFRRMGP